MHLFLKEVLENLLLVSFKDKTFLSSVKKYAIEVLRDLHIQSSAIFIFVVSNGTILFRVIPSHQKDIHISPPISLADQHGIFAIGRKSQV